MKSKTLLVSNIFATVYSAALLWIFARAFIKFGGAGFIFALGKYFDFATDLLGVNLYASDFLYVFVILLFVHIIAFILGCIIGWVAYSKRSSKASSAAWFYLIGTICFPAFLIFGLLITILGFAGGSNQKKLNGGSHA